MTNVTRIHPLHPGLNLRNEVYGVLCCGEAMTCHEIAAEIERYSGQRIDSAHFAAAINRLRRMGYTIIEHDDPDGVRYELVQPGGAA
ncbi:hypothetical protein [Halomonas elongata]|uniref:hypothetical protein n=1 Tax=Halomonas elongata TaxID=2746 RepID=UPI0023B0B422|nr:hypothetical protein [Halomonas elongata]